MINNYVFKNPNGENHSDFLHITVFVLLLQSRAAAEDICEPMLSAFSVEYIAWSVGAGTVGESLGESIVSEVALPFPWGVVGGSTVLSDGVGSIFGKK